MILDRDKTTVRQNGEWLAGLRLLDMIQIGQNFTVQQFLTRENFANRIERGEPIFLHETFYALLQAYDAVAQQTDVQIGGTDQLFNILVAGRKLQQAMGQKPQIALIVDILPGTDGEIKMSKSLGNDIPILAEANDMYGKVMSIPDHAMPLYFKLATRYLPEQVDAIEKALVDGTRHPRDIKMELAREIVSIFHGDAAAAAAEEHFRTVFQQRELPEDMPELRLVQPTGLLALMKDSGLIASSSEGRRLVEQGGVKLDGRAGDRLQAGVGAHRRRTRAASRPAQVLAADRIGACDHDARAVSRQTFALSRHARARGHPSAISWIPVRAAPGLACSGLSRWKSTTHGRGESPGEAAASRWTGLPGQTRSPHGILLRDTMHHRHFLPLLVDLQAV